MKTLWKEIYIKRVGVAVGNAYPVLSESHLAAVGTFVPLYTHMFTICHRSTQETWSHQGLVPSSLAHPEMQPLGRFRV